MSKELNHFLNNNIHDISQFEIKDNYVLIHMKNGDTIEFYSKDLQMHHYKD
jgi:Cu/Ag efflux protein CusF